VLIHSSESEPFPLLERVLQACDLVDVDGGSLADFLKKNEWLIDWVLGGKYEDIIECVIKIWKEKKRVPTTEEIGEAFKEKKIAPKNFIFTEVWHGAILEEEVQSRIESVEEILRLEEKRRAVSLEEKEKEIRERLTTFLKEIRSFLLSFVQSRSLHYGPERLAYYLMAKWMEVNKEPLWEKIVNAAITFFARSEGKSREDWMKENKIEPQKLSIDDENFRRKHEIWVPAVSARYIFGHFFPKYIQYEDPKRYLDPMIFALESPMGGRGIEEWMRLSNPYLYYFLVEEVNRKAGKDIFAIALDFEHMLSSRIDPKIVAELIPEGGGRYIRIIHAGWPSTLAPAHLPIKVGSDAQRYLYELYYKYRQKGFGKDPKIECFILFERGPPETLVDSVIALKLIAEFLEKDVPPEKLPLEFFGISPTGVFAEERQLATIREHAYEPLRDLLVLPEEIHGLFGRAAIEKGVPPEKWKKEELR
jgi:hypothetical protein